MSCHIRFIINSFFIWFVLPFTTQAYAQSSIDFNDFGGIRSAGEVPKIIQDASRKFTIYQVDQSLINSMDDVSHSEKLINEFEIKSNYTLNRLLLGGRVLYGDQITLYLNEIKNRLLEDNLELRDKIEVFTYLSGSDNAFSTNNGIVMINIGLISKVSSEGELAFILSHEIAHVIAEHSFNKDIESYKIKKRIDEYSKILKDERIDFQYAYSKENEFEADSLGLDIFQGAGYPQTIAIETLKILANSNLPFSNVPFEKHYFNDEYFKIPEAYFLEKVDSPVPIKDEYDDYRSHPNLLSRINKINSSINQTLVEDDFDGNKYIKTKEEFEDIRKIARFELIELKLLSQEYGEVIYDAYVLLKEHPDSEFLKAAIAKAFYGLAKYKIREKFYLVARPYTSVQEESQQIHYLLRELTTRQLAVLSLKVIIETSELYPENNLLKSMRKDLIKEMVTKLDFKEDIFINDPTQIDIQEKYFYKLAFVNQLNDELVNDFNKTYTNSDTNGDVSVMIDTNINKSVLVIDPLYIPNGSNVKSIKEYIDLKSTLNDKIIMAMKGNSMLKYKVINSFDFSSDDTNRYNDLSMLKLFSSEFYNQGGVNLVPTLGDAIENVFKKYESRYSYYVSLKDGRVCNSFIYDVGTQRIINTNQTLDASVNSGKLNKHLKNDINKIKLTLNENQ